MLKVTYARWCGLLILAVATMVSLAACQGNQTVVIATVGDYHPFDFVNDDGEIDGLERELGDELCQRSGLECEWILSEWDTMIPDLVDGEFDVILAGMSITDKREAHIDFTAPYYPPSGGVYIAMAERGDAAAIEGKIGVTQNTIYSDYLEESGTPHTPLDGSIDAVGAVLSGDVDAVLVDHGYAVAKLDEHEGELAIVGPSVFLDRGLGIGVRKDSELKASLDQSLESMKSDGSLNALIRTWLGEDATTFE